MRRLPNALIAAVVSLIPTWHVGAALAALAAPPGADAASPPAANDCRLHLARHGSAGFSIEPLQVPVGSTRSLQGGENGLVAVILPPGPGGSASLESTRPGRTFRVTCSDDIVELEVLGDDGRVTSLPPRTREEQAAEDIRVSLTAADGRGDSFLIQGNSRVSRDDIGPHLDPFAGRVPMGPDDVVVFTRTTRRDSRPALDGSASLRLLDGHLYADGVLPDGRRGRFVLDLAAGTTLLTRPWLPPDTEVSKVEVVEHSAAGRRTLAYSLDGATGSLGGLLGQAELAGLKLGGIATGPVTVSVMEGPMRIGEHEVAGIIGTDILLRCGSLSLAYGGSDGRGELRLATAGTAPGAGGAPVEVPFVRVGGLIYLRGEVNGVDTRFILDTGASRSFLDGRTATAAGLDAAAGEADTVKGLDGRGAEARGVNVSKLDLSGRVFEDVPFVVADLTPFRSIGAGQNPGLLGNTFLERFERLELDLAAGLLRLHPKPSARAVDSR